MYHLNNAMSQADTQLRADVWWSLFDDAETHEWTILNGGQRICHLLTPIPGRMLAEQILAILPKDLRDRWREGTRHRAYGSANDIMNCLEKLDGTEVASSRKRKRGKDTVEEVIRALKKDYPDMKLEDSKDILPGLLSEVKKYSPSITQNLKADSQTTKLKWYSGPTHHQRLPKDLTGNSRR
jgi:hypothetical protein